MSNSESLVKKPKLSFFQRIRKALLIRRITKRKYEKAPKYLRNDEEVIEALIENVIKKSPFEARLLKPDQVVKMVENDPDFFVKLPRNQKNIVLGVRPEFISKLDEIEIWDKVLAQDKKHFIKYLPKELQMKLLTEEVGYVPTQNSNQKFAISKPDDFRDSLQFFSPDIVEEAVIFQVEKAKKERGYDWSDKRRRVPLLYAMNISNLPIELQLKLGLIDNEFIDKMSEEAVEKFVGNNPLLLSRLSIEKQRAFIKKRPEFFDTLSYEMQRSIVTGEFEFEKFLLEKDKLRMMSSSFNRSYSKDADLVKRNLLRWNDKNVAATVNVTDYVRDSDTLLELVKYDPRILALWGIVNDYTANRKILHVIDLWKSKTTDKSILDAINEESRKLTDYGMHNIEKSERIIDITKVLLNERVMNSCSPDMIAEFIRNSNFDNLLNIIAKTYGEDVRDIFKDRPLINTSQIENLDIFDEKIRNKYGEGLIHNLLSYDSQSSAILGDLVRHPEKMEKFELFENATKDYFSDSFVDLEQQLYCFKMMEELLKNMNKEQLTPEVKKSLLLVVNDMNMMIHNPNMCNELSIITPTTLEELESYEQKRNSIYNDYVLKVTSPQELKEAICRRFFGIKYEDRQNLYSPKVVTAKGMVNYYSLEDFVSDERTVESRMFTQEELDQLELLTIIDKIDDPTVLKQIYTKLSGREDIIRPEDFRSVREKVPAQYSQELVNSLLTPEKAIKRAESGENGIEYRKTDDGFEVITLNGADFNVMVHSSSLQPGSNNSGICIPKGMEEDEIWKYLEDGCSTVSSCVIEPGVLYSCASLGKVHLGFANVPAKQIIGMSHHDAHVSHQKRSVDPDFEYHSVKFNYPDEFLRRTAAQIKGTAGEEKDQSHEYNEVAMYRRDIDFRKTENGTYGGRVMPDYIIVYGKAEDYHKKLAKAFARDGKPIPILEIDRDAYGDRTYMRAHQKVNHKVERDVGQLLKEIRDMKSEEDGVR